MNYTLITRQQAGKPDTLILSGSLTIRNCFAIHAQLLEYTKQQAGLRLEIKDVEDMDGTLVQLLLALSKYHDEHKKPFYLQLSLNPALDSLVETAGFKDLLYSKPL